MEYNKLTLKMINPVNKF
uniref:Uncharacterized protein n=1 Tax=Moumouvirus sp. 'Monve' TaxID=1128131 RepID=H2EE01_9VIRU|nr:hypothetical protein mv_L419 [Moumouvirus Monve]